jgi:hypothetical protein
MARIGQAWNMIGQSKTKIGQRGMFLTHAARKRTKAERATGPKDPDVPNLDSFRTTIDEKWTGA